jgi:hypothetical protein
MTTPDEDNTPENKTPDDNTPDDNTQMATLEDDGPFLLEVTDQCSMPLLLIEQLVDTSTKFIEYRTICSEVAQTDQHPITSKMTAE